MDPSGLIFLILMMVIFYFMLIRPQKRRAQQHRDLVQSLEIGDEVVTIGGLLGTVARLENDALELEVSPGTRLRFLKTAVARKVESEPEEAAVEEGALEANEDEGR
ncbi:MAG TPA: preprotein translocase subunit YajC [Actinomycetota bacterium]|nr:preprotein translocase subunit YajC [Actinomycetota bacterium]